MKIRDHIFICLLYLIICSASFLCQEQPEFEITINAKDNNGQVNNRDYEYHIYYDDGNYDFDDDGSDFPVNKDDEGLCTLVNHTNDDIQERNEEALQKMEKYMEIYIVANCLRDYAVYIKSQLNSTDVKLAREPDRTVDSALRDHIDFDDLTHLYKSLVALPDDYKDLRTNTDWKTFVIFQLDNVKDYIQEHFQHFKQELPNLRTTRQFYKRRNYYVKLGESAGLMSIFYHWFESRVCQPRMFDEAQIREQLKDHLKQVIDLPEYVDHGEKPANGSTAKEKSFIVAIACDVTRKAAGECNETNVESDDATKSSESDSAGTTEQADQNAGGAESGQEGSTEAPDKDVHRRTDVENNTEQADNGNITEQPGKEATTGETGQEGSGQKADSEDTSHKADSEDTTEESSGKQADDSSSSKTSDAEHTTAESDKANTVESEEPSQKEEETGKSTDDESGAGDAVTPAAGDTATPAAGDTATPAAGDTATPAAGDGEKTTVSADGTTTLDASDDGTTEGSTAGQASEDATPGAVGATSGPEGTTIEATDDTTLTGNVAVSTITSVETN